MKMKKRDIKTISFILFLGFILILSYLLYPLFKNIESVDSLAKAVESYGFLGIFLIFLIQIFQVVAAFIPGEVIEFASGLIYGGIGGFLICMAGLFVGQFTIFKMVSVWGHRLVDIILDRKFIKRFSFLKDTKKVKRLTFILYFLPATPKDLLTYFMPITSISLKEFMIISLVARIPSVLSSTIAGHQLTHGNIKAMLIIYICLAIFGIIGLIIYDKFFKPRGGKSHKV